jgi:hypothetical protein
MVINHLWLQMPPLRYIEQKLANLRYCSPSLFSPCHCLGNSVKAWLNQQKHRKQKTMSDKLRKQAAMINDYVTLAVMAPSVIEKCGGSYGRAVAAAKESVDVSFGGKKRKTTTVEDWKGADIGDNDYKLATIADNYSSHSQGAGRRAIQLAKSGIEIDPAGIATVMASAIAHCDHREAALAQVEALLERIDLEFPEATPRATKATPRATKATPRATKATPRATKGKASDTALAATKTRKAKA